VVSEGVGGDDVTCFFAGSAAMVARHGKRKTSRWEKKQRRMAGGCKRGGGALKKPLMNTNGTLMVDLVLFLLGRGFTC
jgi:hypothetical protein